MKIIYLANARIPTEKAHGMQIVKMCEEFASVGAEVRLVVPGRKNEIKEDLFDYYKIKRNFVCRYLKIWDFVGKFKYGYWLSQLSFALAAFFARGLWRRNECVIFTRDEVTGWLMALKGYRVFYDMHGFPDKYLWLWQISMKKMEGIVGTNEWKLKQVREKFKIVADKLLVARNGFDPALFNFATERDDLKRQLNLPLDRPLVVYVGHLYDWKGADILAQAAGLLPEACLVFVGGTKIDAENFKQQHGQRENILMVGHQPRQQVPLYLRAADVLVLPNSAFSQSPRLITYTRFDTSPIKLFEYMASGRPIVASALPSIKEVVNENNAVLFSPDNAAELAQAIKKVLNDKDLAQRIAQQAQIDVQEYTWENRARIIIEFIKKQQRKTIGFVTTYNAKAPAGLERSTLKLIKSFIINDQDNFYRLYTKKGSGLAGELADLKAANFSVVEIGGGKLWKGLGLLFAAKADLYVFNGQVTPLLFRPRKYLVIVYDFAYRYFQKMSWKGKIKNWFADLSIYLGLRRAIKILAISQATKEEIVRLFKIKPEKIAVIYLGFNNFSQLTPEPVNCPEKFFFFVSTIKERKNVFNLVRAFKIFNQENNGYQLILAGNYKNSDEYAQKIKNYLAENNLTDKVIFWGPVKDRELAYFYQRAAALVYPSFLEGFGFPILEAMGCGLPVITSSTTSTKEVGGEAALLVDPQSPQAIAQAMKTIIDDQNLRQNLIAKGYEQIKNFTWAKTAQSFLSVINNL